MISHFMIICHLSQIHEQIYFMSDLYRYIPSKQKGQQNNEIKIITKTLFPWDLVGPVSIQLTMRILFLWQAHNYMLHFWASAISLIIQCWFMCTVRSNILFVGTWWDMYYLLHLFERRGDTKLSPWCFDNPLLALNIRWGSAAHLVSQASTCAWIKITQGVSFFLISLPDLRVKNFLSLIIKWGVTHCFIVWWWFSLWPCIW